MAEQRDWTTWLNVGGSAASIIALGYLLLHLPRRGRTVVAGFGALPKKGRIPASAVDYAMRKLAKQVEKCGITKAQMREGMSIEREHGDVTKRTIEKTARIAAAHICERPDYYKRLKRYVE
jgi:hypothetical protein